jgi:hypothetical protein
MQHAAQSATVTAKFNPLYRPYFVVTIGSPRTP